uniref:Uncharacterized protein n=1 Tax=Anguilla anguilla TaxID=7936 RepID=A0A0E9RF16_ANGAN
MNQTKKVHLNILYSPCFRKTLDSFNTISGRSIIN